MFKNSGMQFKGESCLTKQGFSLPKETTEALLLRFVHKFLVCLFVLNI